MNRKKTTKKEIGQLDLENLIYGKVPPKAESHEEAVLGACLIQKGAFDEASQLLKPEVFYMTRHQDIFRAMINLQICSQPIDILTVGEELKKMNMLEGIGGIPYLAKLTNAVVSSAHLEAHAHTVFIKYVQREIINAGAFMINQGYEASTDVFELLDTVEEKLYSVTNVMHKKTYEPIDSLIVKSLQRIEQRRNNQGNLTGASSGFPSIDRLTHGFQKTDLIILAARPSVGKTALALNFARNAAMNLNNPVPVAFFSLEMSSSQLMDRLISSESEIHLDKIIKGRLDEAEMTQLYVKAVQKLSKAPLFLDDTAALNIFELRAKCRRLKSTNNIGLIIIDYLQLMSGTGGYNRNRENEISEISRGLKALAKELEVPIIALSQLSREVEKRSKELRMPQLSDLRESGAIEQDADTVLFIYRPEYYTTTGASVEHTVGETHIRFAKNRNGSLDTIKLIGKLWIQKFIEMEEKKVNGKPNLFLDQKALSANDQWNRISQISESSEEDPF
jgi:replicative DNA helicase